MMQSTACVEGECWDCPEDIGACTCECHLCPTCDEPSEDVAGGPCSACWDKAPRSSDA